MKFLSGHKIAPMDDGEKEKRKDDWEGSWSSLERYIPGRWLLFSDFKRFADKFYTFKFKRSDVVVMTYPKCGTTFTQEILWAMTNNPDLCHPKADTFIFKRSPYFEFDMFIPPLDEPLPEGNPVFEAFQEMCPGKDPNEGITLQTTEALPDPRVIKTHLPFSLLSPSLLNSTKVVYVARNPKDVVISLHHHLRVKIGQGYCGSFEDFVQYFVDDDTIYGPYWLHLKEAWEKRNHQNLHFIFFEDLKANIMEELKKLNAFLNTNLTAKQFENIAKYTSFNQMKARYQALDIKDDTLGFFCQEGGFFRKGEVGDWKCRLSADLDAKIDEWIKKHLNFGVDFRYLG